jgi:predicted nucleotidyltransferase
LSQGGVNDSPLDLRPVALVVILRSGQRESSVGYDWQNESNVEISAIFQSDMTSSMQSQAEVSLAVLSRPAVRSVCVFGSTARRRTAEGSDLDLLVVVDDSVDASELRAQMRSIRTQLKKTTQLTVVSEGRIRKHFQNRTVFAAHLTREGRILRDSSGVLTKLMNRHPRDAPVLENSRGLGRQLSIYEDLAWCNGQYLFCLADLYAIGRSAAMLILGRQAIFEFDRERVFGRLAAVRPLLSDDIEKVMELRPFWAAVHRDARYPFPFPDRDSHQQTFEARDSCRALVVEGL